MDVNLFKRIVLEAKELGITNLNLTPCKGEPFLHPDVYEMLEFANDNMREIMMFTNATAINIDKLKNIRRDNLRLCVSYYGSTIEKFNELTGMNQNLFDIFHRKLKQLTEANIQYQVFRRDDNYQFDYQDGPVINDEEFNTESKCKYHHEPKVFANGDVSFCMFAREEWPTAKSIYYTNLNNTTLKEALSDPIRYKFYDSQSMCASGCSGFSRDCYVKTTVSSIKLLAWSKRNYKETQETTDARYQVIEDEVIQRTQQ
jgi:MoaA/NifB/PqqE/SkfB family radical SAM enzyme